MVCTNICLTLLFCYYIPLDKKVLLKALDEGYVILSIIKLLLVGPPAVGKLLLNISYLTGNHHIIIIVQLLQIDQLEL